METPPKSAPPISGGGGWEGDEKHRGEGGGLGGFLNDPRVKIDNFLERWMSIDVVKKSRIWDIIIPGSHDSASYQCTHELRRGYIVSPREGSHHNGAIMEFIKSFVETQDKTVYDQLISGVRFLDLRVCIDPLNGTKIPYCAHGGYRCATLIDVFWDVRKFVRQNPSEVIIISCKPDSGYKVGRYHMTLGVCDFWITAILADWMGDKLRSDTLVGELVERNQNVIYFYGEVERYITPKPMQSNLHRLTTQCSIKLEPQDSVLGAPVIPRNINEMTEEEVAKSRKKIIRYDSAEYYSRHRPMAKHRDVTFEGSDWDLFTSVLKNYVISGHTGSAPAWSENWTFDRFDKAWELDCDTFEAEFAFRFRGGEIHAAAPIRRKSSFEKDPTNVDMYAPIAINTERFEKVAKDYGGPFRLRPQDAARYKQMGLTRVFFEWPLKVLLSKDLLFVSYLRTGRTIITKSWGQTCDNNVKFLAHKLKYWAKVHGREVPRPPYRLRLLAGELTPPSPDFPQPGAELMKFWALQSASALFFIPTGAKPNAQSCNKVLLNDILVPSIVTKVNGITHDFVSRKLILTMLFHHVKYLRRIYAEQPHLMLGGKAVEASNEQGHDMENSRSATSPPQSSDDDTSVERVTFIDGEVTETKTKLTS